MNMSELVEPIYGPELDSPLSRDTVMAPRLARHQIVMPDGHLVGVTVAGAGVPLVVVHGFSAEGFLYAQSLSRLVRMGFRVIAVDTAGHGATQGLPLNGQNMNSYAELLGHVVDELGIEHYLVAGHSMGGQLATRLAAARPEQVMGLVLIDAIVGDTWDWMVRASRVNPMILVGIGGILVADSAAVIPAFSDPRQAMKLIRLVAPTLAGHMVQPWRLLGPVASILRTRASRTALDKIRDNEVPVFVLHGAWDMAVPHKTGVDTVKRTEGVLVTVRRAGHSWILRDPETLPSIVSGLLSEELGEAIRRGLAKAGLRRKKPTIEQIEKVCYAENARVFSLTAADSIPKALGRHRRPKYAWDVTRFGHPQDADVVDMTVTGESEDVDADTDVA